jgi:ATP-binding cassette, subfamily B, bacterial
MLELEFLPYNFYERWSLARCLIFVNAAVLLLGSSVCGIFCGTMRNPITSMLASSWKYAKGHRATLVLAWVMSGTANLIWLFGPYVFGKMLEEIQVGGEGLLERLVFYLVILAVLPLGFWAFHGVARIFETMTAYHIWANYDEASLKAIFGLPMEWHRGNHSGKNIDKFKRAGHALFNFANEIFELIEIVVTLIGAFVLLFFVEAYIGIVAAVSSALVFGFVMLVDRVMHKQYQRLNKYYNRVASAAYDYISNVFTVLTMRFEKNAIKEYLKRYYDSHSLYKKNSILNECKWASVTFMITIMTIGVIAWEIIGTLRAGDVIMVGTLYMIYAYLERIGDRFYRITWKYSNIVKQDAALVSANNLFKDHAKLGVKVDAKAPKGWKKIRIEGIHFKYEDEEKEKHQIKNVSFEFSKGEKIAFVGESGCGKSTVLGLLRGIYRASKGKVFVDGKVMKDGMAHLADMTTLMPQEPELFENTIRYNIAMGVSAPLKKVKAVAKMAKFESVVRRLPDGLETNIAEKGVNLSGGEKQRLALARGLLAGEKSDVLLMDEPTSSVDMKNEKAIFEAVFKKHAGKTVIASVHRLNLLPMFDTVCYFEGGRLVKVERA